MAEQQKDEAAAADAANAGPEVAGDAVASPQAEEASAAAAAAEGKESTGAAGSPADADGGAEANPVEEAAPEAAEAAKEETSATEMQPTAGKAEAEAAAGGAEVEIGASEPAPADVSGDRMQAENEALAADADAAEGTKTMADEAAPPNPEAVATMEQVEGPPAPDAPAGAEETSAPVEGEAPATAAEDAQLDPAQEVTQSEGEAPQEKEGKAQPNETRPEAEAHGVAPSGDDGPTAAEAQGVAPSGDEGPTAAEAQGVEPSGDEGPTAAEAQGVEPSGDEGLTAKETQGVEPSADEGPTAKETQGVEPSGDEGPAAAEAQEEGTEKQGGEEQGAAPSEEVAPQADMPAEDAQMRDKEGQGLPEDPANEHEEPAEIALEGAVAEAPQPAHSQIEGGDEEAAKEQPESQTQVAQQDVQQEAPQDMNTPPEDTQQEGGTEQEGDAPKGAHQEDVHAQQEDMSQVVQQARAGTCPSLADGGTEAAGQEVQPGLDVTQGPTGGMAQTSSPPPTGDAEAMPPRDAGTGAASAPDRGGAARQEQPQGKAESVGTLEPADVTQIVTADAAKGVLQLKDAPAIASPAEGTASADVAVKEHHDERQSAKQLPPKPPAQPVQQQPKLQQQQQQQQQPQPQQRSRLAAPRVLKKSPSPGLVMYIVAPAASAVGEAALSGEEYKALAKAALRSEASIVMSSSTSGAVLETEPEEIQNSRALMQLMVFAVSRFAAPGEKQQGADMAAAARLFDALDADSSGVISVDDFEYGLRALGFKNDEEVTAAMIAIAPSTVSVTKADFLAAVQKAMNFPDVAIICEQHEEGAPNDAEVALWPGARPIFVDGGPSTKPALEAKTREASRLASAGTGRGFGVVVVVVARGRGCLQPSEYECHMRSELRMVVETFPRWPVLWCPGPPELGFFANADAAKRVWAVPKTAGSDALCSWLRYLVTVRPAAPSF